ncbi:MAG TPA: hypothetical protein DC024_00475 [Clostridiales bacterium]|jgi:MoxR-like ATPase|nr:hypothetical protein [Clostridiales bacterium]
MTIPEKSREQVIEALRKFDRELRNTPQWEGWEEKLNFKYALSYEDRIYPVKEIIRLATKGFTSFSGGPEANDYLKKRGFTVEPLREDDLELDEKINLDKLNKALQSFAKFRKEKEEQYLGQERNYKLEILGYLQGIFSTLISDPEKSKNKLRDLMAAENVDISLVRNLNNLLGNRFTTPIRDDFRVFLESIDAALYKNLFSNLFDEEEDIKKRFWEFRMSINELYSQFYNDGRFSAQKKSKPVFSAVFTAILLAGYNHGQYTLYKASEYTTFLEYLEVPVPGSVEDRYKLFLEASRFIKEYAVEEKFPIQDLIDVHNLIFMFSNYEEMKTEEEPETGKQQEVSVYHYIKGESFIFPTTVITDYIISLITKPFVILSGISGTGKTKIAQLVAEYITGGDPNRVAFISVRPDWTDNSALLGYYNTITEQYEGTPLLELLLRARDNPGQSYFVILDEMNLAKVEHYFSDFLSVLESRRVKVEGGINQEPIYLHNQRGKEVTFYDADEKEREIPSSLLIPPNVFFTGTVNVDETTYMFSPKVLDRANTIEFNEVYLGEEEETSGGLILQEGLDQNELLINSVLPYLEHFRELQRDEKLRPYYDLLVEFNTQLRRYNLHFGYRVVNEISVFLLNVKEYCRPEEKTLEIAFDLQIKQKILPKFHGNIAKLQEPLEQLREIIALRFPESQRKIDRMLLQLEEQGFTSFIE